VKVKRQSLPRVSQGDIIRDVEYVEYIVEKRGVLEASRIIFPLVIVLTQDCDLEQDYKFRWAKYERKNEDKWLLSTLVAPLYNADHFFEGNHLAEIGMRMLQMKRKSTAADNLRNNQTPRYQYLEFPPPIPIPPSVIDFKHYFSVNVTYLKHVKRKQFVCSVGQLFREDISVRFASFLARIALPEEAPASPGSKAPATATAA
jgi:hypothetical protein